MPTDLRSAYRKLLDINKNLIVLGTSAELIHWDMETMMPPRAVSHRSEQLAQLSQIHHKLSTSPKIGRLLDVILKDPKYETLSEVEKRNVQLIKKNYDEQTKLPTKLVTQLARQEAITVNVWKKAKAQKNYALFKPELEKLVALNKQAAEILMKVKETKTPYDALVDIFEPKMTSDNITRIFTELRQGLQKLLDKIEGAPNKPDTNILHKMVPVQQQREIAKMLAATLGYDVSSPNAGGRIDETEHPFTQGYYDDVRITTHYYPDNFASSVFSVLHETGHALYDQNLNPEWKYQPIGQACSHGVHESQSRLYENLIGRSSEFWTSLLPKMKTAAPDTSSIDLDPFIRAINTVKPSKIRIEADEVTYGMHIIIRFQIEKDLFADKVKVSELPGLWNQKYKEYLGMNIEDDAEGVMQDTHWASGYYGYFPSYALGNIYSGQILETIQHENPDWRNQLAKGNLDSMRQWLTKNIYNAGRLYDPADLLKKVTGKEPTDKPFLRYLEEKYSRIYGF
ncbi:MAG: carboxypeptidase M32 [Candidatus Bathyarchaeia archaeon]